MSITVRSSFVVITAVILVLAASAQAKDQACVDGSSCLCDKFSQTDPGVVYCEDFESPLLDQNGTGSGWTDKYGAPVDGCWQKGLPGGDWAKTVEGTCPTCCVNVVKETGCEVPGQTDCVFEGSQSLGHRFHPGATQGIVGTKPVSKGTNFGVTMAVKFSRNYVNGDSPKKTDEFGQNCSLGCSSATYVSSSAGNPFHGVIFWDTSKAAPTWQTVIGNAGYSGTAFGWYPKVPSDYDFNRDHGIDTWHCWRLHISNVGQLNAQVRHWIDNRLLVRIDNVDLRNMYQPAEQFNQIMLNNYANEGYPGASIAYRYEDNIVITTSSEPATCEAIGFNFGSPPPAGGLVGTPGQPKLIP